MLTAVPMTMEELAAEVLSLPSESHALLAEQLFGHLDAPASAYRLDELWAVEAQRRLAGVRSGRAQTVSGEGAAARMRRAVGQ